MNRASVIPVEILPVEGLGEITAGDDLAALIHARIDLRDGDVVVVSSKIVSKALGLTVAADTRDASIASASVRLVAARRTPRGVASIVQAQAGPVMAAAGVDNSNVAPGTVLLLPSDPDACARDLLAQLRSHRSTSPGGASAGAAGSGGVSPGRELGGVRVGVIISDTGGRAWRNGQTDFALGAAGIAITDDLRGGVDTHGQPMEVTVRALADEIAAAADLVKGKLTGVPVAVVRGLSGWVLDGDGPGAASMLRPAQDDWFRLGHVEAVRASLGVNPADVDPPSVPAAPVAERLARVLDVALTAQITGWTGSSSIRITQPPTPTPTTTAKAEPETEPGTGPEPEPEPGTEAGAGAGAEAEAEAEARVELTPATGDPTPGDWLALGALAQAIAAAAWTEDLTIRIHPTQTLSISPALLIKAHPR